MKFDKNAFAELINQARGQRSQRKYAEECGVDNSLISRYIRMLHDTPPEVDTIWKLASVAHNSVTYEAFMIAAGYLRYPLSHPTSITTPLLPSCMLNVNYLCDVLKEYVKKPENMEFLKSLYKQIKV